MLALVKSPVKRSRSTEQRQLQGLCRDKMLHTSGQAASGEEAWLLLLQYMYLGVLLERRQSQRSGKSVLVQPRGSADKHTYLWDARGINNQTNGDNYF